jgi:ATP-dependent Clp protease ATP-binding subunit ClpA
VFDRFDDGARRAIVGAQEFARARRSPRVDLDDLLVAVLLDPDGSAAQVLHQLGVEVPSALEAVLATVPAPPDGAPPVGPPGDDARLPWSDAAKAALDRTGQLVAERSVARVGTEHLLLGLLSVPSTPGLEGLLAAGATREGVLDLLVADPAPTFQVRTTSGSGRFRRKGR